jgi:DNA-binding transcriptional MerR regulator
MEQHHLFTCNAAELAELAIEQGRAYGLPVDPEKTNERLVRYYVAEGVVDRPERVGRDAAYGQRHLLQLLTARRMAQAGVSLADIAEHNRTALTRTLEEELDKPMPTPAELLVNSLMQRKKTGSRSSSRLGDRGDDKRFGAVPPGPPGPGGSSSYRPSPALPDVLDEVHRVRDQLLGAIDHLRRRLEQHLMAIEQRQTTEIEALTAQMQALRHGVTRAFPGPVSVPESAPASETVNPPHQPKEPPNDR